MKESTQQLILNAEETLNAAEMLFKEEYLRDAINRAYDEKYHKLLTGAFRRRMLGDYDEVVQFKSEEVKETITGAWDFLQAAKSYLEAQR